MSTEPHTPYQHPYQPPEPPPPPRRAGISVRATILVVLGAFVALVGVGALVAGPLASATSKPPVTTPAQPAAQVKLEPISSSGDNPFMTPVGTDQTVAAPANTGGQFSGDTPGLYGDTGGTPSCDASALVRNLLADESKATAWAAALGITPDKIPDFVRTLTPVLLRSDTAVTSYGYADGRFTAYPAVLQSGTAVFVDSYGAPTVKCFSGDPLSTPTAGPNPDYAGPAWPSFQPTTVTVIRPVTTVVPEYTFINVHQGTRVHCAGKPSWPHRDTDWRHGSHRWPCDERGDQHGCPPARTDHDGSNHHDSTESNDPHKNSSGKDSSGKDNGKDNGGKDNGKDNKDSSGKSDNHEPSGNQGQHQPSTDSTGQPGKTAPDTKTDTAPDTKTDTKTDTASNTGTTGTKLDPKTKIDPKTNPSTKVEPNPDSKSTSDPNTGIKTKFDSKINGTQTVPRQSTPPTGNLGKSPIQNQEPQVKKLPVSPSAPVTGPQNGTNHTSSGADGNQRPGH